MINYRYWCYSLWSIDMTVTWKILCRELRTFSARSKNSINVSYYYNTNLILDIISGFHPAGKVKIISKLREWHAKYFIYMQILLMGRKFYSTRFWVWESHIIVAEWESHLTYFYLRNFLNLKISYLYFILKFKSNFK